VVFVVIVMGSFPGRARPPDHDPGAGTQAVN
jgi:hypothetical protein